MTASKPYLLGLTGGIACGKSHLSQTLRKAGAYVIDADEISHQLTVDNGLALPALKEAFPTAFDGALLNRKRLAEIVFTNPEALASLNSIMHPLIKSEIIHQIEDHMEDLVLVLDIPLLFETSWDQLCDEVWCAYSSLDIQKERLLKRGFTVAEAMARLDNQMSALEKARRSHLVIETNGSLEQSANEILLLWQDLMRRKSHEKRTTNKA